MKRQLILIFLFLFSITCYSQTDTIYIEEIDTVIVTSKPVMVTKTVYKKPTVNYDKKYKLSATAMIGILWDLNHYNVCEECKETFDKLKSSSSSTRSVQYGLQVNYHYKKMSLGVDISYRQSSWKVDYSDAFHQFNSTVKSAYFMVGPVLGYKLLYRKRWETSLYGGVLFSFTTSQKGKTLGGQGLADLIDLSNTSLIAKQNFVYHASLSLTYKLNGSAGILFTPHYYFDNFSNVNKQQSYTEQRNSLGASIGLRYYL